jgi:formiminoglutamase
MLENWLSPINLKDIELFDQLSDGQVGRSIRIFNTTDKNIPDLKNVQIGIIGIGSEDANAVRSSLYALSFSFQALKIADLGNVRKSVSSFLIPLISELLNGGICPVIIGRSESFTLAQFQAYHGIKHPVNIAFIDERIRYAPKINADNYTLHQILGFKNNHLFHCSFIGYQTHYTGAETIDFLEEHHYEHIRLGKLKSALEEVEPIIRDADFLSLNIAVLKQSEAPGQINPSPSGLFVEDLCQLTRYAGMSDKLTSVGIYGYNKSLDSGTQTAQVVALLVWYFMDGFFNRKHDYPSQGVVNHLVEYIVYIKDIDYKVTFWKSNKSGRWWMQIPAKTKKKHDRHRLIPCSYNDYMTATNGDLPERLMNAYKRFG